ncbi:N-acetylneuraminate synthase family protein [Pelagibacterales bacterium SAG-MED01]|nr:N-acetylneuraminate synthase family protein [Pelagibacterales bacterium SAG-MED01]
MKNTLFQRIKNNNFFIIAEIGNNHGGNILKAKKLIIEAKKAGADAVKFQFINPENLVSTNENKRIKQLKKICLNFKQFELLNKFCKKKKIEFFSSIFDINYINKFSKIQNIYKVASGDNNYYELIKKISLIKKPTIISTGLLNNLQLKDLKRIIFKNWKKNFIKKNICLMHCVSSYPCPKESLNISFISKLKKDIFITGYSDHSIGIDACIYAYSLGANIIEKHFTLTEDKKKSFRDHKLSATPLELKKLIKKLNEINLMKGNGNKKIEKNETLEILKSRRSLHTKRKIKKSEVLTKNNVFFIRPGGGIPPSTKNYLGKKVKHDLEKNQLVQLSDFNK